jgi:hypothetical protein
MGIITVTVNSKEHNIDTMIMPYFASNTSPNHTIPISTSLSAASTKASTSPSKPSNPT